MPHEVHHRAVGVGWREEKQGRPVPVAERWRARADRDAGGGLHVARLLPAGHRSGRSGGVLLEVARDGRASRPVRRSRFSLEETVRTCVLRHRVYSRHQCVLEFVATHPQLPPHGVGRRGIVTDLSPSLRNVTATESRTRSASCWQLSLGRREPPVNQGCVVQSPVEAM